MIAKRILIVDDDMGFAKMLVDYFKGQGYDPRMAVDIEEALRIFQRHRPSVVLLDFSMPLVNGDKFLPILQDMNPAVKTIVISGFIEEDVEAKFKGLGYFAFFTKGGLTLEDLKKKVEEAFTYS